MAAYFIDAPAAIGTDWPKKNTDWLELDGLANRNPALLGERTGYLPFLLPERRGQQEEKQQLESNIDHWR